MPVGYARVSTLDQNAALQVDALRGAGCDQIFIDRASGATTDRPQLRAALRSVQPGDALVVWKLDRLARSLGDLLTTVAMLSDRNVGFISLTENIDTQTPAGRLVLHLFGALAEFERAIIQERTIAGLAAARARGRVGGRPRKMTPALIAEARRLILETDKSVPAIAAQLGVSLSSLYAHVGALRKPRELGD